nr:MAG TPA: Ribonucleotide reductase inhibitor [Caudoviricetes sp.]
MIQPAKQRLMQAGMRVRMSLALSSFRTSILP